jgi:membrane-associated phospholipid phosphatase
VWWAFFAWSVVIALSTLTTKQHYLVDVAGGLLLAVGCVALVERVNARLAARLGPAP